MRIFTTIKTIFNCKNNTFIILVYHISLFYLLLFHHINILLFILLWYLLSAIVSSSRNSSKRRERERERNVENSLWCVLVKKWAEILIMILLFQIIDDYEELPSSMET